jgi:hypothetical protein
VEKIIFNGLCKGRLSLVSSASAVLRCYLPETQRVSSCNIASLVTKAWIIWSRISAGKSRRRIAMVSSCGEEKVRSCACCL